MPNGQKTTWWIGIACAAFLVVAGWSVQAGTSAKHEAHIVQGRFDEYVSGAKERENMMIYRLEQVEKSIGGMETKLDELLKRE